MTWLLALALLHGSAALADGYSTRLWESRCAYCHEEPLERWAIGARPTWERMAPAGTAEVVAAWALGRELRRHPRTRHVWWLPQALAIGAHTGMTVANWVNWGGQRTPIRGRLP